jgi:hypothetical protein
MSDQPPKKEPVDPAGKKYEPAEWWSRHGRTVIYVIAGLVIAAVVVLLIFGSSGCAVNLGRDGSATITDHKELSGSNRVSEVKLK